MTISNVSPSSVSQVDVAILALDLKKAGAFVREYFIGSMDGENFKTSPMGDLFSAQNEKIFSGLEKSSDGKIMVYIYPTRTYSEGMGGGLFSDMEPGDRRLIRKLRRRFGEKVVCYKVPLRFTGIFEALDGYFATEEERSRYKGEKAVSKKTEHVADGSRALMEFDGGYLSNMGAIFRSCMTIPNKQDYMYLVTKTFGLNLAVRLAFTIKAVRAGELGAMRAVISTSWYQFQDAVFTVFGQTYMKFLGRMTGMFRVGNVYLGDFLFVYIQLCGCEFLNRLVLGPLGENPLVYTWRGMGLIFLNIIQGMISGGPITPAINKMRRSGAISHSTMMHLYQLASLTMLFGLFATFGHQMVYTLLTTSVLVLSWGTYILFSTYFKDAGISELEDSAEIGRIDTVGVNAYSANC